MDYCSLFRDGTIGGLNLKRRHQSGLNVMAPKRIKNNDFATNLVPTERCLASWASQWSCYMFTWPLLSPASIIGEKSTPLHKLRMIYAISSKKKDWYMSTYFFSFLFCSEERKKRKGDISLYCRTEDHVPVLQPSIPCSPKRFDLGKPNGNGASAFNPWPFPSAHGNDRTEY